MIENNEYSSQKKSNKPGSRVAPIGIRLMRNRDESRYKRNSCRLKRRSLLFFFGSFIPPGAGDARLPIIFLKHLSFLFLLTFLLIPPHSHAAGATASISKSHNIPIITVTSKSGDYYALGKAHGEIIRKTEKNAALNMKKFISREKMFYNDMDLEYLVDEMEKTLPDRFRREMQGFADGINGGSTDKNKKLSYNDIVFINLVGDITRSRVMCSAVAFGKRATGDGSIILGRNLDWIDGGTFHLVSAITIFRLEKVSLASFGISGLSTVSTGINNHGVFIGVLSAIQKDDNRFQGKDSVIFTIRYALEESKNTDEAVKILSNKQFPYSCIFLVGDRRKAVILEKSGKKFALRDLGGNRGKKGENSWKREDILISTNHFLELSKKNQDKNSGIRMNDLEKAAENLRMPLGVRSMEKLLSLCENKENPVYQRLTEERRMKFATLMSVIAKPADLNVWIWFARKVPADGKPLYERIDLGKYF